MPASPVILEIAHSSADYHAVLEWRDRVLRRPLGLKLTHADVAGEEQQRHFVMKKEDQILAGVIAAPLGSGVVRLRQMWVRDDMIRQGLGRALLTGLEPILSREGCVCIRLHARSVVRGFYENCGYLAEGSEFKEIGIPHIAMIRRLSGNE